jgi:hypothetical protein
MTDAQVVATMSSYCLEYQQYFNYANQRAFNYRDRVYYCGLAIATLQNIRDLANAYPGPVATMPATMIPNYSNAAFNNLIRLQSRIYHDQLIELRRDIRNGTYRLGDEMAVKSERARAAGAVISTSTDPSIIQEARRERNSARLSMVGTAIKYPLHAVARIIQGVSRLVGNVLTLPAHIITYPMHMIINPDREYTGHIVQEMGDQIGNLISTGVRLIDNGIMRL